MAMKRLFTMFTDEQWAWLRDESLRRGCSVAQVIRDVVLGAMKKGG